ncbi:MAG TPA: DUF1385 domain-containing protein [Candidatus Nanoarchaeia archaeon]|nr:DUF1385 domain-containing protein [Candidatus Nanoarchaeia archaeon]
MKPLGGQAIMEGVMIKAPDNVSMAVRVKNNIITKREKHKSLVDKYFLLRFPFIRGIIYLFEMMVIGIKALTWSANQQGEEEELGPVEWAITFGVAILLTIGLFIILPYYAAKFFAAPPSFAFNLIDGIVRLLVFIGYLFAIGRMADVRRMFQYHGAEHMAVHCYEHKKSLTVKNVKNYPPEHPRCGTSLLVFVVCISIILFSFIRTNVWYLNIPLRVLLVPFVAGVSYELLKFSAKYSWLRWLSYPGIWTQKLTTRQPTTKQIEVAIAAVNRAK